MNTHDSSPGAAFLPAGTVPIGGHVLPPLPYPYDALEPYISRETLRLHHDLHHQGYVNGLNRAERELLNKRQTGDFQMVRFWERELAFNGSGHILHSIYWTNMTPLGGGTPGPSVSTQLEIAFGSFAAFKGQFTAAANEVQGSGWAALVWNPAWRRLEILQAEKHEDLTQWGSIPILVVDVWEHAYYVDYRNQRARYLEAWWNVVNWVDVERRLLLAVSTGLPIT
ncbi:MAG: superoxide dismutase [Candidatus Fermentithermobacillus carboniphilus]|uniref:Superoxide dismutase n=1 Tax=Candidatus Fermentithermobacillus carboniphilus TaxID=3085328 RepID=A0AAT9LB33_9FIRM|nr:MAG: superoxide dismutase [Candidatus Fermentithermobacillus carboniphilus]